jgi:carbon-monoxide dehydrogenase large subunit
MSGEAHGDTWFGRSVLRKEDAALLTGRGRYTDDISPERLVHACILRSPHAHARIRSIDTTAAKTVPGVHAVYTFADLPEALQNKKLPLMSANPLIRQPLTQPVMAKDEVRYVGESVAVVLADTRRIAEDAAALIEVDYESLPAINDVRDGLKPGAATVHADAPGNLVAQVPFNVGDIDAAFAKAKRVVKGSFDIHRGSAFSMEARACLAMPDAAPGSYTLYLTSQSPHRIKRILMDMLGFADHEVRCIAPDVGGGFGPKGSFYPEYALITACAMRLERPVKWTEDRAENFVATQQERDQFWDIEVAINDDARILGLRGRLVHENGAYVAPLGLILPWIAITHVQGPYVIPAFSMDMVVGFTNKVPTSPVRGAGRPQAVFVMERMMDHIARETGLDPAEVRRRNFIQPSQMPYNCQLLARDNRPVIYDSGDYPETQRRTLAMADYDGFRARQAAARKAGRHIGIGMASFVEGTGLGPYESATVRVGTNGKIIVCTGAAPQGQSHKTTLAQICADQLGVSPDDIDVVTGDTGAIAIGVGTFAARSAVNAGNAVHGAAVEVRNKALLLAASMLKVSVEKLELKDGVVYNTANPEQKKTFREVSIYAAGSPGYALPGGVTPGLEHTAYFTPERSTYSNGCHVVEAEVDIWTGHVTLNGYWIVDDCGKAINPQVVLGQVIGGTAHGIGNALLERLMFDENAQPLTTTFAEYLMPLATDVPRIEVGHMESPSPLNPLGVKGAGEGGTLPAIAAVIGAIEDALSPFGVTIDEAPVSPMRIVELIRAAAPQTYA